MRASIGSIFVTLRYNSQILPKSLFWSSLCSRPLCIDSRISRTRPLGSRPSSSSSSSSCVEARPLSSLTSAPAGGDARGSSSSSDSERGDEDAGDDSTGQPLGTTSMLPDEIKLLFSAWQVFVYIKCGKRNSKLPPDSHAYPC